MSEKNDQHCMTFLEVGQCIRDAFIDVSPSEIVRPLSFNILNYKPQAVFDFVNSQGCVE